MENMACFMVLFPKSCYKIMFVRIVGIGKHSLLVRWVLFFAQNILGIHLGYTKTKKEYTWIHVEYTWIHVENSICLSIGTNLYYRFVLFCVWGLPYLYYNYM